MEVSARQAAARRRRRDLPAAVQAVSSAQVARYVGALPEMHAAGVVATFIAGDGEVSLWPVVARLWDDGVEVTVPAIDEADDLIFLRWRRDARLEPGRFGIPVPQRAEPVAAPAHDVILLAGVLFGPGGARVGRGRGYYDRALAFRNGPRPALPPDGPLLVGVGHSFQWAPELRCRRTDVAVDAFVSPAGVRRFGTETAPWN